MKKILLFPVLFCVFTCIAQQSNVDSLRNLLNKHPQKDTLWLSRSNKLVFAYRSVDPLKGLALADTDISLALELGSKPLLADAYVSKGGNFIITGLYDSALQMYNNAMPIFKSTHNQNGLGTLDINLGIIYFYKSLYLQSIFHEKQAELIFKSLHDELKLALVYSNLGLAYEGISALDSSLQNHQKAMRILEKNNRPLDLARVYGNLSEVYRGLKKYNEALIYGQKALMISSKAGDNLITSDSYAFIGQAYYFKHEPQKAIDNYLAGLKIADKYNFKNVQSVLLQLTGSAYNDLDDYKKAFDYLKKSIDLFISLGDQINLATSYDELSKLFMHCPVSFLKEQNIKLSDRYLAVLNYQNKSFRIAKEIRAKEKEEIVLSDMSDVYMAQGNYRKAYEALKQSIIYKDSVLNDEKKQEITRFEMQYQFDKEQDSLKAANDKKQLLADAEIRQQQTIRNTVIAGMVILLISGIGVFIAYKKRRDAKAKQHDAEMQMQMTDTEMKALRAQMNPHFLFNSLNAVNAYINKNEARTAADFLTKFSSLMRRILVNSEEKTVLLENELETLSLYLELQALRLQHKFSYEINIGGDIDTQNTLFPPLLLQPFLENCIVHGFAGKDAGGKIIIDIQKEGDMLKCSVEDNGLGLTLPVSVENILSGRTKSLGLKITIARINIINNQNKSKGRIELKNIVQGTRAEITIPFETKF